MRAASGFDSFAFVATTPIVVFSPARGGWRVPPLRRIFRASARVPSGLRTPAMTLPVAGSTMSPTALTATMAATMRPLGRAIDALPMPAFIDRTGPTNLPDVALAPARVAAYGQG